MARAIKEQLEEIKKKHNVDTLYSWSRVNCYKTSTFEYYLNYIAKAKRTRDNIYGCLGNLAHTILEDLYEDKIKYEDMSQMYEDGLDEFNIAGLKFDRSDEDKNKAIAYKYEKAMRQFFTSHQMMEGNIAIEKFILINIKNTSYLQGYIDAVHKEGDDFIITDFKTSSIYRGKKQDKEKGQLVLYALGLSQMGIPIENIKIRWNFLKYTNVTFVQKNGKEKTMVCERHEIVNKLKARLLTNLRDLEMDEIDIQMLLAECIDDNSLDKLPQDIQDLYTFTDCYEYPELNQTEVDMLVDDIHNTIQEIEEKTKLYNENGDETIFYDDPQSVKEQSYYFANLSSYSPYQHIPYKMYLEENQMFRKDEEKKDYDGSVISSGSNDSGDSWLDELGL